MRPNGKMPAGTTQIDSHPVPIERRSEVRYHTNPRHEFRAFFSAGQLEGEGTVLDLTKDGCRVQSETPIEVGATIELWMFLPDFEWPVRVEAAKAEWIDGLVVGLSFTKLRPAQRERLRKFLQDQQGPAASPRAWQ